MGVFQKTVFKEFVARQNQDEISLAYQKFQEHFGNPDIQANILEAKEEQYQEGFLKDLFVDILGYTLFPQENHNLQTEIKNPNDAKKADAAIVFQEKVSAVIELKSTRTPLLKMMEAQAFGYKNQHQNCRYVITSNFRLLGFYLDNAYDFEEFDLFDLNLQQFGALYTILHRNNLEKGLPIELKQKSIEREQELTLAFYNDYQGFKDALFLNIAQFNKQFDPLLLFEKTQKLLDRVVFMCFAEDKGLLPANLIKTIIAEFECQNNIGIETRLYDRFKAHFYFIDQGFKSKKYDIYAYNGGLFAPDEVLDQIKISDEVLESRSQWISRYDFESDIDVNVLGHIFEHSLNELDKKRVELLEDLQNIEAGLEVNEDKRKVDGIFYTPIYITKYIVNQTLGKLCDKQKLELGLQMTQLDLDKIENKEEVLTKIDLYESWLKNLKVLDPACGSGAFLNQVLSFFIYEYQWLQSLKMGILPPPPKVILDRKALMGSIFEAPLPLPAPKPKEKNIIHQILENNIFGVDLNSEGVSITKLSLWLKTAQMKQKLNDLAENIKIGNSLIDNKEVDPKAFDWQTEFAKAFENPENQGFTIIVGNPPYVRQELLKEEQQKYFAKRYPKVHSGTADLYVYFYAKALELLQKDGLLGFITPNKWFKTKYGENLRKFLKPLEIQHIVDFFELKVFDDAATEPQVIILKNALADYDFDYFPVTKALLGEEGIVYFANKLNEKLVIEKSDLRDDGWTFATGEKQAILNKIIGKTGIKTVSLNEYSDYSIYYGIKTGLNKAFIIDKKTRDELMKKDIKSADLIKPYIQPTDIKKWHLENTKDNFLIVTGYDTLISAENYPAIYKYLKNFEKALTQRQDKGKTPYNLRSCAYYEEFEKPKIMYIHTSLYHGFYYDVDGYYLNNSAYFIRNVDLFLSAYLNSKPFEFYKKLKFLAFGNPEDRGRNQLDYNKMVQVPVPVLSAEQKIPFEEKAKNLQIWSKELAKISANFSKVFLTEFKVEKANRKLEKWQELDWAEFQNELKKQKGVILPKQKMEWLEIFESQKEKTNALLQKIRSTENELNQMFYKLYNLSAEEIKIVENG